MNALTFRRLGVLAIIVVALPRSINAAAPAGHYVVATVSGTATGTVYDSKSKLTWQRMVSSTVYAWAAAQTYCAGVGTSPGGTGWRLPTMKELQSLVDYSQSSAPLIDQTAFPATPANYFWSASAVAGSPSNAWDVNFSNGYTYYIDVSKTYNVRCVR